MAEKLSGVTVVIFIAFGIQTFILLFIFAKRQIMRFALRSRRGPHIPIGHGAKNSVKKKIEHHIEMIPKIIFEPPLRETYHNFVHSQNIHYDVSHIHRLKTVTGVKFLEKEIAKKDPSLQRPANENLRSFLLLTLVPFINGSNQKLIHQFCDLYEHARYDPSEFGEEDYQTYLKLLLKLIDIAKLIKLHSNSKKSSPSKTPVKKITDNDSITGNVRLSESTIDKVEQEAKPKIVFMHDNETSV